MTTSANLNPLTSERLTLRPFTEQDAPTVAAFCNNPKLSRTTLSLPYPYSLEDALDWIAKTTDNLIEGRSYELAITDLVTGELYGCIGLSYHPVHRVGEMGYWIGEPYWGRGYATEAVRTLLRFAFEVKSYHKVFARHFASNPASGRVMLKNGMRREGVQRQQFLKDGVYQDSVFYGVLAEEYAADI
ncbi:MAG: GNAT family N-acetyltransferase [Bacilli bacterium]